MTVARPRVLVSVHAHPDDNEAFVGGTLALLAQRGWKVVLVTATAGDLGGMGTSRGRTAKIRTGEAAKAAAEIGASYVCLGEPDGFVFDSPRLRLKVGQVIRQYGAGAVFTHRLDDYHPDHRAIAKATEAATLLAALENFPCKAKPVAQTPVLYHTQPHGYSDFMGIAPPPPSFFLDISQARKAKRAMLACHQSQIALMKHQQGMDDFFGAMEAYGLMLGKMSGVEMAEALWLHRGAGFPQDDVVAKELEAYLAAPKGARTKAVVKDKAKTAARGAKRK